MDIMLDGYNGYNMLNLIQIQTPEMADLQKVVTMRGKNGTMFIDRQQ